MSAVLLDPCHDARWADLVESHPEATIFHHPRWLALLRAQYGYSIGAAGVFDGGELVGGLPFATIASRLTGRRMVAVPFSDECAPLLGPGTDGLTELCALLDEHRRARRLPLEIRASVPQLPGAQVADLFHVHVIDLQNPAKRSSMTRRNVNKARRSGVTVERRTDREALDAFYALHLATRRRQGVPTQPRSFIRAFADLFAEGLGFVALARHEGRVASAAVFLGTSRTLTYKYGASDQSALAVRPNNLLFEEAIAWGTADGYHRLDLGRTDFGHEGLRSFKSGWGAEESTLAYTYAGRAPDSPEPGRAQRMLAAVITRTPPIVGRAAGAALYRHAG